MPKFKTLLQTHYDVYQELEIARLLEIPDTYLPQLGERPRVNLGICHEPGTDQVVSGISAVPRLQEQDIVKDIDKLVPDDDLEKFISRTVWLVNTQIEEKADRHTIETDIQHLLDTDPDFRFETTKPLPKGIHPAYTGTDAELWQKPASRVHYMDGSQGFLQIWIPVDEGITLIDVTAGGYDRQTIIDAIRESLD